MRWRLLTKLSLHRAGAARKTSKLDCRSELRLSVHDTKRDDITDRPRVADLIMTLYQTPAVVLGALPCGSAQNGRILAASSLTGRQADASHKRQLARVDCHDLRDWMEEDGVEDSACISAGMHPQRPSASRVRRGRVAGDSEKETDYGLCSAQRRPLRSSDRS